MASFFPFGWRYGSSYRHCIKYLEKSQYFSEEVSKENQLNLLKKTLSYAYANVPYYKKKFTEIRFNPFSISSLKDIEQLPFLTKKDIFDSGTSMVSTSIPKSRRFTSLTGGTTGNPIELVFDLNSHSKEWAFMHTQWKRVGYTPDQRKVTIIGVPFQGKMELVTKVNPLHNELLISPFQLNEEHFNKIIEKILNFMPSYIHGLPSCVSILADYMIKTNKKIPGIKAVLCSSENIMNQQRSLIEQAFKARLFSWYGHTEKAVLGGECEYDTGYHIFPDYGYTELIDEKNKPVETIGSVGEIVGTSFVNMAQPLIRYRTGDLAVYKANQCSLCKRNYLIIEKVVGRRDFDILIDRNKKIIPFIALDLQKKIFCNVFQWQFIQKTPGIVQVNILANSKVSQMDLDQLGKELAKQTNERLFFNLSIVNELIKTRSGKTKVIINELGNDSIISGHN